MCDEEDNTPYRLTTAYRRAAVRAAKQNERQRRAARIPDSQFVNEPWLIPHWFVTLMQIDAHTRSLLARFFENNEE